MRIDLTLLCIVLAFPALADVQKGDVLVGRTNGDLPGVAPLGDPVSTSVDLAALQLMNLHKRMIAKDHLSADELRVLADSGDGLAAFKFATLLEHTGRAKVLPDAVHYYSMAILLGRNFGQSRLVALMSSPDVHLTARQIKSGHDALVSLSNGGDADAAMALASMYEQGHPFAKSDATAAIWLAKAAKDGNADAAQKLAFATIMPSDGSTPDPKAARAALSVLAKSPDPGKVAIAQNLLARLDASADTQEVSQ